MKKIFAILSFFVVSLTTNAASSQREQVLKVIEDIFDMPTTTYVPQTMIDAVSKYVASCDSTLDQEQEICELKNATLVVFMKNHKKLDLNHDTLVQLKYEFKQLTKNDCSGFTGRASAREKADVLPGLKMIATYDGCSKLDTTDIFSNVQQIVTCQNNISKKKSLRISKKIQKTFSGYVAAKENSVLAMYRAKRVVEDSYIIWTKYKGDEQTYKKDLKEKRLNR